MGVPGNSFDVIVCLVRITPAAASSEDFLTVAESVIFLNSGVYSINKGVESGASTPHDFDHSRKSSFNCSSEMRLNFCCILLWSCANLKLLSYIEKSVYDDLL